MKFAFEKLKKIRLLYRLLITQIENAYNYRMVQSADLKLFKNILSNLKSTP